MVKEIISLAEYDYIVYHFAFNYQKIQRRINALEDIMIPRLESEIHYIGEILDDLEREEFIRLKKIKNKLEKEEKVLMVRPVKMSLLSLYIRKELLPNLLSDLIQIKYFHVKDPEESSIPTNADKTPSKPLTVLSEEDYKKRIEKITLIQTYLDDIFAQIEKNPENVRPPKKENRIEFDYSSLDDILNDLQSRVDFNYRRLENMAKELESVDEHLENLAEVASLLNIIAKFGGESYSKNDFKRLHFDLYTASSAHYTELSGSINQLNSPIVIYGEPISDKLVGFFAFYENEQYKLFHDLFLSYNCHRIEVS